MIEETAHVSIEIGINTKLQNKSVIFIRLINLKTDEKSVKKSDDDIYTR